MTKEQLNQKEQHYAGTLKEAEEIILAAKENVYLTKQQISEKHNKLGTYFLVDLTYSYNVPREIMENESVDVEQEPQHEGLPVTQSHDGSFQVDPNQMSIDEVVDEGTEETESSDAPF
ncbi:organic solvent tolerance protein OstA [Sporosarcina sp. A2]|uniref:organic solvent tolerance protein OstA n=1 Tax=Sporosarcina sp. A2 TaxID=3393449 RepID=UPI003D7A5EB2